MSEKAIVLDANILIRAVLGHRVRELISVNAEKIKFYAHDVAYKDARKYLPELLKKRKVFSRSSIEVLEGVAMIVRSVNESWHPGRIGYVGAHLVPQTRSQADAK
jgi:hypothetical protein